MRPDLWFFGCHFTGDPVMPGCLGLDAMWQLVGYYSADGRTGPRAWREVKFSGQVSPSAKVITIASA